MPPKNKEDYSLQILQQFGKIQGQMETVLEEQKEFRQQFGYIEKRLSNQIDKVVVGMNSKIEIMEGDLEKMKLKISKLKWRLSYIGIATTFLGALAAQWLTHLTK